MVGYYLCRLSGIIPATKCPPHPQPAAHHLTSTSAGSAEEGVLTSPCPTVDGDV